MSVETNPGRINVVILEDNPRDAEINLRELRRAGFDPEWVLVETEETFLAALEPPPDLILSDFSLPQFDGLRAVDLVRGRGLDIPFILISGTLGEEAAIDAMKRGVDDYLLKTNLRRLGTSVAAALDKKRLRDEQNKAEDEKRRAEELLRVANDMQRRVLNALPAHIAVLDSHGVIVTVNEAWRRFASANVLQSGDFCVGQNYLGMCDSAHGDCADEAQAVAAGIRQVLGGETKYYSLEYPCHSPTEKRWYRLMVTPLSETLGMGVVVMHVNVTDRRLTEEVLREQEQEQRRLVEQLTVETQRLHESQAVANVGSWETDLATFEVAWSDETFRIFETSPDQFKPTHQGFLERVHPEDRRKVDDAFNSALGEQGPFAIEHRLLFPDGRIKWVEERWDVFKDAVGRPARTVGTCQDITERKAAADELRKLSQAVEQSPSAIVVTDLSGYIEYVNPKFTELTGYTAAEALGQNPRMLKSGETPPEIYRELWATITAGKEWRGEMHNRKKNGETYWAVASISPVLDEDGQPTHFLAVNEDITERRAKDAQLRLLETCVSRLNDIVLITEAEPIDDPGPRILYVNDAFVRRTGFTREEAIGQTPRLLQGPKTQRDALDRIRAALKTWQPCREELINYTKSGEEFWLELDIVPVADAKGWFTHWIAIERDVTERKKMERQLLRTQRLESIGTLAGGIAHDLNNALAPIMMSVEVLRLDYPSEPGILEMIESSARRSAGMVRQLLTFAKGAEGERVALHPGGLVTELERLMKGSFPKNIHLAVKSDPNLPLVIGDATQLHQVLLNLCVNARDAMPHGGTLALEAQRMEVDAAYASSLPEAKPGNYLTLRVRDTGTGIPPEVLDRIFDPFFTTKGPDQGTGLGLSTVIGIVKGHGGFVQVYSQPGRGSTFTVYLPADHAGTHTEFVPKPAVDFRGQDETILFVDDEANMREIARTVLRRLNFNPLIATDGADGIIQAAEHRTKLRAVITDVHMPHMDGVAFVRALRRMLPDIPIVVASGQMGEDLVAEFKALGATERLDKPFTEPQLAEALKNVLVSGTLRKKEP